MSKAAAAARIGFQKKRKTQVLRAVRGSNPGPNATAHAE